MNKTETLFLELLEYVIETKQVSVEFFEQITSLRKQDKHEELKALYLQDEKTCSVIDCLKPWELWQSRFKDINGDWEDINSNFIFLDSVEEYRRHPHANLKILYAKDILICKEINELEAWNLWEFRYKGQEAWNLCTDTLKFRNYIDYHRRTHANNIIVYHKCNNEDKKRWQVNTDINRWEFRTPTWSENFEYRMKQETIMINDNEYNAPMRVAPDLGTEYYVMKFNFQNGLVACNVEWEDDISDGEALKNGRAFETKENCQAICDAFNNILAGVK